MKANHWATRFAAIRREKDKALLRAVEEQIIREEAEAAETHARLARAFGRVH